MKGLYLRNFMKFGGPNFGLSTSNFFSLLKYCIPNIELSYFCKLFCFILFALPVKSHKLSYSGNLPSDLMLLEFTLANLILFAHIIRPIDNIDTQQVFMFVCSTVLFESFAFVDVVILVDECYFTR